MTDSEPSSPRPARWRQTLPMLVVALAGLAGGVFLATRELPSPDGATALAEVGQSTAATVGDEAADDMADETHALAALQASLQRSQVLPADFRTVPPFTLAGGDGGPLTESFLEGHWSLMFFGFTNCPDVCPITLSVMKEVVAELEQRGIEPMQVVFVTVDPVRDTPERMREYVNFFDEDFIPVSGELNAILELTRTLGIVAAFTANEENPDAYTVDHTASMLLIDPERRVRAKFTAPHERDTIVADYAAIRGALN